MLGKGRDWAELIPAQDLAVMRRVFDAKDSPLGRNPLLLVVDVVYGMTGTRPLPIEQAVQEYRSSCGSAAWEALPRIASVIEAFRSADAPVIWTRGDGSSARQYGRATKAGAAVASPTLPDPDEFNELVRPTADDEVLTKTRASAFFGTPLAAFLTMRGVDSLVVVGGSTSGCVRASAVDAFSAGHKVFLVDDCCFDRSAISHAVSMLDLGSKYVTLRSTTEIIAELTRRSA